MRKIWEVARGEMVWILYLIYTLYNVIYILYYGLPWWLSGKASARQKQEMWIQSLGRKIPWRRKWQNTSVFFPGKSQGQRSLGGPQSMKYKRVRPCIVTKYQQYYIAICILIIALYHIILCCYRALWAVNIVLFWVRWEITGLKKFLVSKTQKQSK